MRFLLTILVPAVVCSLDLPAGRYVCRLLLGDYIECARSRDLVVNGRVVAEQVGVGTGGIWGLILGAAVEPVQHIVESAAIDRTSPVSEFRMGTAMVEFEHVHSGLPLSLVLDPEDHIAEITERNNRRQASTTNQPRRAGLKNPFFAFDNGTGRGEPAPEVQAKILKEIGYAGIGYTGAKNVPAMLSALDKHDLEMFSIYVNARLGPDGATYDLDLAKGIDALKGRDTIIWLTVTGEAENADEQAVGVVREIADLAERSGLRVALYPHVGFYVARVEDALRIVRKVDRENVGVSINLCHWLKLDDEKNMTELIEAAMPHLFLVSINGADRGDTKKMGWDQLIQTLDRGSFDVYALLKELNARGYDGPIGLQAYNVKGDIRDNLTRSMSAWRGFVSRMADSHAGKAD